MNLTIDLSPSEAARLSEAAKLIGLAPAELVKKLVKDHLPAHPVRDGDSLDAKLRKWQDQDGTKLMPDVAAQTLFAQWAEEDAQMTDQEHEAEDRLWKDLEKGLSENSGVLRLRRLG